MTLRKGSVVQGSQQDELVIVRHRPGHARRALFWRLVSLVVVAAAAFAAAWFYNIDTVKRLRAERDTLQSSLQNNQASIDMLSQQVGILEKGGQVDRQAADSVRESIRSLEDQVDGLEEELAFYKSIMDPAAVTKGLKIHSLSIQPGDGQQAGYRLMLTQVSDNGTVVEGYASVTLQGSQGDQTVSYALSDLSDSVPSEGILFRFRYFQEATGTIALPEGFTPSKVLVVAESTGRKARKIEATFDWPTQ